MKPLPDDVIDDVTRNKVKISFENKFPNHRFSGNQLNQAFAVRDRHNKKSLEAIENKRHIEEQTKLLQEKARLQLEQEEIRKQEQQVRNDLIQEATIQWIEEVISIW